MYKRDLWSMKEIRLLSLSQILTWFWFSPPMKFSPQISSIIWILNQLMPAFSIKCSFRFSLVHLTSHVEIFLIEDIRCVRCLLSYLCLYFINRNQRQLQYFSGYNKHLSPCVEKYRLHYTCKVFHAIEAVFLVYSEVHFIY
jgi:hypothetical protein